MFSALHELSSLVSLPANLRDNRVILERTSHSQIPADNHRYDLMRNPKPQPKDKCKVSIPQELRESMREAHEIIQDAERDPEENPIDFGDAIQVGAICGGRIGSTKRPFQFTYFPVGDTQRGRWFLNLHVTEIEDIADGVMTDITMFCCTSSDCRCKFRDESDTCFFCDYEDDIETAALKEKLNELVNTVASKEEFVAGYLKIKPNATSVSLIGDYNPIEGIGERLGWFSSSEAQQLIDQIRSESENTR